LAVDDDVGGIFVRALVSGFDSAVVAAGRSSDAVD
jgi:hypothetical protein